MQRNTVSDSTFRACRGVADGKFVYKGRKHMTILAGKGRCFILSFYACPIEDTCVVDFAYHSNYPNWEGQVVFYCPFMHVPSIVHTLHWMRLFL